MSEILRLQVVWAPIRRRKGYPPKIRGGGVKFNRRMKTLGRFSRRPHNPASDPLLSAVVFEHKSRIGRKILLQRNERTVRVHAEGSHLESRRCPVQSDMDLRADPEQNALAASALFTGGSFRCGIRRCCGWRMQGCCSWLGGVRHRFQWHYLRRTHCQKSTPQKSSSD